MRREWEPEELIACWTLVDDRPGSPRPVGGDADNATGDGAGEQGTVATTDAVVGGGPRVLAELKEDPGQLGLETLLREVGKLRRVRAIGLPPELFADASEKLIAAWRARAARSAHTVAAGGDSMPPEPPLDEAYLARMLEGIARRGYIPASPRPSR